ncbi:MAG: hypothetical protein U0136_04190 [Bdellovibrionota bacterium]
MSYRKRILFAVLLCASLTGCTSDCIYKLYDTSSGDQLCGRFCPKQDEEGNDVVDSNGDIVYDKPEPVNKVNCILPSSSTSSTSSTSTSTSTSSTSSGLI